MSKNMTEFWTEPPHPPVCPPPNSWILYKDRFQVSKWTGTPSPRGASVHYLHAPPRPLSKNHPTGLFPSVTVSCSTRCLHSNAMLSPSKYRHLISVLDFVSLLQLSLPHQFHFSFNPPHVQRPPRLEDIFFGGLAGFLARRRAKSF